MCWVPNTSNHVHCLPRLLFSCSPFQAICKCHALTTSTATPSALNFVIRAGAVTFIVIYSISGLMQVQNKPHQIGGFWLWVASELSSNWPINQWETLLSHIPRGPEVVRALLLVSQWFSGLCFSLNVMYILKLMGWFLLHIWGGKHQGKRDLSSSPLFRNEETSHKSLPADPMSLLP